MLERQARELEKFRKLRLDQFWQEFGRPDQWMVMRSGSRRSGDASLKR
jgi:hypothetical protein